MPIGGDGDCQKRGTLWSSLWELKANVKNSSGLVNQRRYISILFTSFISYQYINKIPITYYHKNNYIK